ncbi:MAG: phage tail tape measure protein, partial [Planctomycetaceae bacterium]
MSGGTIRAGRAFVEIFLKDKLTAQLRRIERRMKNLGAGIAKVGAGLSGAGAAIGGPLVAAVAKFVSVGDQLDKMSQRTGVSVKSLSTLGFAAEQSGASIETLEKGVKTMQRSILDANRGLSTSKDALTAVGLTVEELNGLSPEQQFKKIADGIAAVSDPSKKAALAMQIFGRSGQQLVPLLSGGAAGMEALQEQARSLGIEVGDKQSKAAAMLADSWNIAKKQLGAAAISVGGALAPMLTKLLQTIQPILENMIEWVSNNKGLIVSIAAVAAGLVVAGGVLIGLGAVVSAVGSLFGVLASVMGAVLSPIGLIIAGVVGLGAIIATKTSLGSKALSFLADNFGFLKDDALAAFDGIKQALAGGDIRLAASILFAGLNVVWQTGVLQLTKVWIGFKRIFLQVAADAVKGVMDIFGLNVTDLVDLWASLETAWTNFTSFLADAWSTFTAGFRKTWSSAQNLIAKGILHLMGLFDSSLDVQGAIDELDAAAARRSQAITNQRDQTIADREKRRKNRLAEIEASKADKKRRLDAFLNDSQRNTGLDQQGVAAESKLAEARKALAGLVDQARNLSSADSVPDAAKQQAASMAAGMASISAPIGANTNANTAVKLNSAAGIAAVANVLRGS